MDSKYIDGIGTLILKEGSASRKINVNLFGCTYKIDLRIRVYNDEFEGITQAIISLVKNYLNNLDSEMLKVMTEAMDYYKTEVKEMADDRYCDYINISNFNELSQVLEPIEFYFVDLDDYIKYGISFRCNWDDDGFAIRYGEKGNIKNIGTTDVLY